MDNYKDNIFFVKTKKHFEKLALYAFNYQYKHNIVYNRYVSMLGIDKDRVKTINDIPYLPISFFKTHKVLSTNDNNFDETKALVFSSSGTTDDNLSYHYLLDSKIYEDSYLNCFKFFFSNPKHYIIYAFLPFYLERKDSSLVYMVRGLINESKNKYSQFHLEGIDKLKENLLFLDSLNKPVFFISVSFCLLELAQSYKLNLKNIICVETGGMKGKRKEITREELHEIFKSRLGLKKVYSEYGMTELLTQSYSKGDGIFVPPPWMRIRIRDIKDPISINSDKSYGAIDIIDLANINSCCFISTEDIGMQISTDKFKVLGRLDGSDIRGCNILS